MSRADESPLPPGQVARADFPRFGLTPYAERFPAHLSPRLYIGGDAVLSFELAEPFRDLPRVDMAADFHCVTTWSHRGLRWSGVRFADFYRHCVEPRVKPLHHVRAVVLRGQDGYRSSLLLEDVLVADVLLADTLDGKPLTIEHGAPLRLVAPAHYGYKSVKHLSRIECWTVEAPPVRTAALRFMDHPRARVEYEERGRWFPGWLLRRLYRPLIESTVAKFAAAMRTYRP